MAGAADVRIGEADLGKIPVQCGDVSFGVVESPPSALSFEKPIGQCHAQSRGGNEGFPLRQMQTSSRH